MDLRAYLRHLDYIVLPAAAGLLVYGVAMIYFATRHDALSSPIYYARYQIVYAAVGIAALVVLVAARLRALPALAVAALRIRRSCRSPRCSPSGPVTRGSRRWLALPFVRFQPSELALVILTVTLAAFLSDRLQLIGLRRMTLFALALRGRAGGARLRPARPGHGHGVRHARRSPCCSSTARPGRTSPRSLAARGRPGGARAEGPADGRHQDRALPTRCSACSSSCTPATTRSRRATTSPSR